MIRELGQVKAEAEAQIPPLVSGIVEDTQLLFRKEIELARAELREELVTAREAAIGYSLAVGLGGMTILLMTLALVHLISLWTPIPLGASYALVGLGYAAVGAACYSSARKAHEQTDLMPRQTIETMKENIQWIGRT